MYQGKLLRSPVLYRPHFKRFLGKADKICFNCYWWFYFTYNAPNIEIETSSLGSTEDWGKPVAQAGGQWNNEVSGSFIGDQI